MCTYSYEANGTVFGRKSISFSVILDIFCEKSESGTSQAASPVVLVTEARG